MAEERGLERLTVLSKVALCTAAAMGITLIVRNALDLNGFLQDSEALGNYLQVIGAIYAFVVGFVLYVVWTQFTKLDELIDQEVGRLRALWPVFCSIKRPGPCLELQRCIRAYATKVINARFGMAPDEWEALALAIRTFKAQNEQELIIFSDMLRQLDELTSIYHARISLSKARIPWVLWDLIFFITVITVLPFCILPVRNLLVDLLMVGSMAASLSFMLIIIHDIDQPFRGVFNITFTAFKEILLLPSVDDNQGPQETLTV